MDPQHLSITIAARPRRGEPVVADAWHLAWHETTCRIALIHGDGAGFATADVVATAVQTMTAVSRLAPAQTIAGCHEALRGTSGASLLVARFDGPGRRLALAGAGEIAATLYRDGDCLELPLNRGSVGGTLSRIDAVDLEIGSDWLLIVRTTGDAFGSGAACSAPEPDHANKGSMLLPDVGATILTARPR